jgi:hypothetical protein
MKRLIAILIAAILFVQCGQENNTLIQKNQLGKINKSTSIAELDKMFKNDSIEKFPKDTELIREYRVFGQNGKQALVFNPLVQNDSIKGLELVKIYSDAYVTEKGISTSSTFGEISGNYTINKIEPSFSAAILFIDEINATISLNKKDLNLDEFDMRPIREDQIPDEASINYITLWFE